MQITGLRLYRINNGLKQKDFAEAAELSIAAIHDIETGRRKPSFEVLIKLLKFMEKPYYREILELFERKESNG